MKIYVNELPKSCAECEHCTKAIKALERVKKEVWFPSDYKDSIIEEHDQLIKEYGGKNE